MATFGYHASHEQFAPSALLSLVRQAEDAGFTAAMCSDHFHPWGEAQGHSGHAWTWLGAAMATTRLPFGVVNAPVGRYHPAVIAQAAATLGQMFPDRFWIAAGSGEALNESITGAAWPAKAQRNERLKEAVAVMRALWAGEEVSHSGHFDVQRARLYTRPATPPPVYIAALSADTARWAASWADGLITIARPPEQQRPILDAFREGGGEGKPMLVQVKVSWATTDAEALAGAHAQWRTNVFAPDVTEVLRSPAQYDAAARFVRPEDMHASVRVSADLQRQAAWLRDDLELGFDRIYLHNVNTAQAAFIDAFGALLPSLR